MKSYTKRLRLPRIYIGVSKIQNSSRTFTARAKILEKPSSRNTDLATLLHFTYYVIFALHFVTLYHIAQWFTCSAMPFYAGVHCSTFFLRCLVFMFCWTDVYVFNVPLACQKCSASTAPVLGHNFRYWRSLPPNMNCWCHATSGKVMYLCMICCYAGDYNYDQSCAFWFIRPDLVNFKTQNCLFVQRFGSLLGNHLQDLWKIIWRVRQVGVGILLAWLFAWCSSRVWFVLRSQQASNKWLVVCGKCSWYSFPHWCANFPEKRFQNNLFCTLDRSHCPSQYCVRFAYNGLLCCRSCPLKEASLVFFYLGAQISTCFTNVAVLALPTKCSIAAYPDSNHSINVWSKFY